MESVTQSVSNLALAFGDDDAEGGVMVSFRRLSVKHSEVYKVLNSSSRPVISTVVERSVASCKIQFFSVYKLINWYY